MRRQLNTKSTERPRFYSVSQVASLLGMSAMTIYRAIEAGEFPAVKIRGRWIVPAKAVDAMEDAALAERGAVDAGDFVPGGGVMTKQQEIADRVDAIYAEVEQQLRLPDSVDKFAELTKLHEAEASCWRELTESSRTRLSWLSAIAAGERARSLAEHWASRAHGVLLREGRAA